jgi:hypothetical protein
MRLRRMLALAAALTAWSSPAAAQRPTEAMITQHLPELDRRCSSTFREVRRPVDDGEGREDGSD